MRRRETLNTDEDPRELELCDFCYPSPKYGITPPILYEDENVYVMPSVGQFTEGYLLLVHQDHVDCFAEVPNPEIEAVKESIRDVLTETYGACCFYEHGRTGSCLMRSDSQICYHAHLHCVPVPKNYTERIEEDFERIPVDEWSEIGDLYDEYPHYLYLETDDGEKSFFVADENIERQYLRKRACEALDLDTELANWADNPRYDKIYETVADLRDAFDEETVQAGERTVQG